MGWKLTCLALLWLGLAGCATTARQTEALLKAPGDLPPRRDPVRVDFLQQTENYCGPATLAMAMGWAGRPVTPEAIAAQVYTPGREGSLQQDMLGAARRHGLVAVPVQGMWSLLREVSAGHPVIVLENLGFRWYPMWHYALVLGYDLAGPSLTLHSGKDAYYEWDLRKFERSWMLSDYWGMVVLPPGRLAASADDLAHSAAAAALEQLGWTEPARLSYRAILSRWPQSLGALIGLGNLAFAAKDYSAAVRYLRAATAAHPGVSAAWHNLALAESAAGRKGRAAKAAARALELAPPIDQPAYRDSLRGLLPEREPTSARH